MSEKREIISELNVTVGTIYDLSNGITEMRFNSEYLIDKPELLEVQNCIDNLSEKKSIYLLVIPGPEGNMTKEAREEPMFSNTKIRAIAIIADMLHQRILGNLYFKFKKAHFTNYKLFKEEKAAVNWLLSQKAEDDKN